MASPYQRPGSSLKKEKTSGGTTNPAEIAHIDTGCTWKCSSCIHTENRCLVQSKLLDNCLNFLNSRVPSQFMFHKQGQWIDFPQSARQTLIDGFKAGHCYVEIETRDRRLVIDFMSMCMLNLATKEYCSVAWIDEDGNRCFPKSFIDGGAGDYFENIASTSMDKKLVQLQSKIITYKRRSRKN